MRILLVEDEPLVACDLEAILTELGCKVVGTAESSVEALQLASDLAPSAALIDVRLRDGFTGPDVARSLGQEDRIRCAFVTGNPEQVSSLGLPVVPKPFSRSDIEAVLKRLAV